MIKAAIAGANTPLAGELIRILVNHPDVELTALHAPGIGPCRPASVHHGLIGESIPDLSERLDPTEADVIFICNPCEEALPLLDYIDSLGLTGLKVIDLSGAAHGRTGYVCGISELYRKQLVRGATRAYIPAPEAAVALIMLHPLAANLLLPPALDVRLQLTLPQGMTHAADAPAIVAENLSEIQHSFVGNVSFVSTPQPDNAAAADTASESAEPADCAAEKGSKTNAAPSSAAAPVSARGMRVAADIPSAMQPADILQLFDNIYDDHNFCFTVLSPLDTREAEGTHKCLISLSRGGDDWLRVEAVADCRMRGGAGDAVHVMNLLFGLHEKVGLTLKASTY